MSPVVAGVLGIMLGAAIGIVIGVVAGVDMMGILVRSLQERELE